MSPVRSVTYVSGRSRFCLDGSTPTTGATLETELWQWHGHHPVPMNDSSFIEAPPSLSKGRDHLRHRFRHRRVIAKVRALANRQKRVMLLGAVPGHHILKPKKHRVLLVGTM